jgi:hypothetical protein
MAAFASGVWLRLKQKPSGLVKVAIMASACASVAEPLKSGKKLVGAKRL